MTSIEDRRRAVKHPGSNGIPWPKRTKALFRRIHVSAAILTFWCRQDRANTGFSIVECQLIYIAFADEILAKRPRFNDCPLDAMWTWYYRKTGYLRRGYECVIVQREDRRRAA
jgi:hypothetical protein